MISRLEEHLEKLSYFKAVCEQGSIGKAAKLLRLSQPGLSRSMKRLEDCLEARLFERSLAGIQLTQKGRLLLQYANEISAEGLSLSSLLSFHGTVVRVGTHEIFRKTHWDAFIARFQEEHPEIHLHIMGGRIDDLVVQLRNLELDALVTVRPLDTKGLSVKTLYSGHLEFYGRAKSKKRVFTDLGAHLEQFKPIPKTLSELGCSGIYESGVYSFKTSLQLAESGEGIAVVPDRAASREARDSKLKTMEPNCPKKELRYSICFTTREDSEIPGLSTLKAALESSPEFSDPWHQTAQ